MKNNLFEPDWTDFTIDGKCSNCGQCCSNILPMSDEEVLKIRNYIKKHNIKPQLHLAVLADPAMDMICPFADMSKELKCTIYPVRPLICRDFVCNKTMFDAMKSEQLFNGVRQIRIVRDTFFPEERR